MSALRHPLYRPGSLTWRALTEWPYLLGGMRAVLMQLAHPAVAAGVADHSGFEQDAFTRLHRTMRGMWEVGTGDARQAEEALGRMRAVHARVRGTTPEGRPYRAEDPELLLWVHATLVDTALTVDERYLRTLSPDDLERYYRESLLLAEAFEIPSELVPPDLSSFRRYLGETLSSLRVSDQARRLGHHVLHPGVLAPDFVYAPLRLVTADLLPPVLREAFGLPWERRHRLAAAFARSLSRGLRKLPRPLRTLPLLNTAAVIRRSLEGLARR